MNTNYIIIRSVIFSVSLALDYENHAHYVATPLARPTKFQHWNFK